jgi:bacteriorhodopsin
LVTVLILVLFGFVYLFRTEFMPYHADAVGQSWAEVTPAFQVLIIALMRVVGGAFLATACAMGILLFKPFREGGRWAYWAIPLIGMFATLASLYATLYVRANSPASPPWTAAALASVLLVVGFVPFYQPKSKR